MMILNLTYTLILNKKILTNYFSQKGSVVSETFNICSFLLLIFVTQALTVSPLTSISQAPQLPVNNL